jgi:outer membrane protein OmpA-like peptidoglycan-associated protein
MKKSIILLVLVCCISGMIAQVNKYQNRGDYEKAILAYKRELVSDSLNPVIWKNLAECNRIIRDNREALKSYRMAYSLGARDEQFILQYAKVCIQMGQDREALNIITTSNLPTSEVKNNIQQSIENRSLYNGKLANIFLQAININTARPELCPIVYGSGIAFLSTVEEEDISKEKPYYKVFFSSGTDYNYSGRSIFELPSHDYHVGPVSFTDNQSRAYYSSNFRAKGVKRSAASTIGIFEVCNLENNWIPTDTFEYNSPLYSCMHPTVVNSTDTLYFTSDMPGGAGGYDIWMSAKVNGKWGVPVNVISANTMGNEVFPYVSSDGSLYFSSDTWPGLGGLDLFVLDLKKGIGPVNLGAPLNSSFDDFSLSYISQDRKTGYITSNRKEGDADDDIYFFRKRSIPIFLEVSDLQTGEPLLNARITISTNGMGAKTIEINGGLAQYEMLPSDHYVFEVKSDGYRDTSLVFDASSFGTGDEAIRRSVKMRKIPENIANLSGKVVNEDDKSPIGDATVVLRDMDTGQEITTQTNKNGDYRFEKLALNKKFNILCSQKNCNHPNATVSTDGIRGTVNLTQNLSLLCKGDVIQLENIYYDYNKSDIRPESFASIDILLDLLNKNPTLKIEIRSHTDSKGKDAYNEKLSKERAKKVVEYLISKNVDAKRLKSLGLGEKELLNPCDDGVECDEKLHEQNRRTEFKILSL